MLAPALDPVHSRIDNHVDWWLQALNGQRAITEAEVRDRFSPLMLTAISPSNFLKQTETLIADGPYRYRGVLRSTAKEKFVSLSSQEGDGFISVSLDGKDTQRIEGLFIGKEDIGVSSPVPVGYLTIIVLGGLGLAILGAYLVWQQRIRVGAMLLISALLHLSQLFSGFNVPALFSLGLFVPAFAPALLGHATLCIDRTVRRLPDMNKDRVVLGSLYLTAIVSSSVWLLVNTAMVGLPHHLFFVEHSSSGAHTMANVASICALISGVLLVVRHIDRYYQRRKSELAPTIQATFMPIGAVLSTLMVLICAVLWLRGTKQYRLLPSILIDVAVLIVALPFSAIALAHVTAKKQELAETRASRARLLEATDSARRQIERDLHDGTQQRLLAALMGIRRNQQRFGHLDAELNTELGRSADDLQDALNELRDIARGLHPSALDHGLPAALEGLAERAPLPVELHIDGVATNIPLPIATAAYFVASEAITNAARHAQATYVCISVTSSNSSTNISLGTHLRIDVSDNGTGGADFKKGTGLRELADRVEALGGSFDVDSHSGRSGTRRLRESGFASSITTEPGHIEAKASGRPTNFGTTVSAAFPLPTLTDQAKPIQ